ncbi:hypothetical protein [Spirillospora sp. NPDC029432]|uniref:hypothetical protein n=1 Tax=Spirillospora sp. NPDC029432 TaxID=3154599 RepID=UPI0034541A17
MRTTIRGARALTSSAAALAVLAPAAAVLTAVPAAAEPVPVPAPAHLISKQRPKAAAPPAKAQRAARVNVTHAWIRGRILYVHGTVKCKAKGHRGRLVLIAQQPGGPHVGPKPLKSPGRTGVRCDGDRHRWSTWHSSRSHEHAKGKWRRGKPVQITGALVGPKPTLNVDDRVRPR